MNLTKLCGLGIFTFFALAYGEPGGNAGPGPEEQNARLAAGKELFTREWLAGDRRSYAGDGLGPVFNARSCVTCHHQGGVGGAGPKQTNVTVVSAFLTKSPDVTVNTVGSEPVAPAPIMPPNDFTLPQRVAKDGIPLDAGVAAAPDSLSLAAR